MEAEQVMAADGVLDLDELTNSLGFLTRAAYLQIGDLIRHHGKLPISPPMLTMLALVRANPGIRQVNASRVLLIHDSNMALLVKELVAKGLVERRPGTGRRAGLWITQEGHAILSQSQETAACNREYAQALSDQEYDELVSHLRKAFLSQL